MRRFSTSEMRQALICSFVVIAVLSLLFIRKEPSILFAAFQVKDLILLVFQVILLVALVRYPMSSRAKKKGIIGLSLFILIRNLPLMLPFSLTSLNYSLPWFMAFFLAYFTAAVLMLSALRDAYHD